METCDVKPHCNQLLGEFLASRSETVGPDTNENLVGSRVASSSELTSSLHTLVMADSQMGVFLRVAGDYGGSFKAADNNRGFPQPRRQRLDHETGTEYREAVQETNAIPSAVPVNFP